MKQYLHGGNHPGMLEFSANLNPLGMPEQIKQAIRDSIDHLEDYPDPRCESLCAKLADAFKVSRDSVVCTAGASDGIVRLCQAIRPKRALVSAPCFSGYEKALDSVDCTIERFQLSEESSFDVSDEFLDRITARTDIVFVCTPNNPTGRTVDPTLIRAIAYKAAANDALLVIDESFLNFTDEESAACLVEELENVAILGSFTKMYAMAGIRLGFIICGSEEIRRKLDLVGMDWAVSTTAQAAGNAALDLCDFVQETKAYVGARRSELCLKLREMGIKVVDGAANYLLIQAGADLAEKLADKNIAIRTCGDYHGLDDTWFRIAVRTETENETLIDAIREAIHDR